MNSSFSEVFVTESENSSSYGPNVSITEPPVTSGVNTLPSILVPVVLILIAIGFLFAILRRRNRNYARFHVPTTKEENKLIKQSKNPSEYDMLEMEALPRNNVSVEKSSAFVGPSGATVMVGGCRLVFPDGALDEEVEIHLTSIYGDENVANRLTPLLKCEPHGLKFLKDVEVTLPTCFMTNGETSVAAVARRSEDEMNWEDINLFDHRTDRSFTFVIQSFSWYDVVVIPIMKYFDLIREKSVVCGIPHDYSDDPDSLIMVCYIFDSILHENRLNCKKIYKTTLMLRSDEPDVTFQLTSDDVIIAPENYRIPNALVSPEEEAHFTLRKRTTNLIFHQVTIHIQTSSKAFERPFPIPPVFTSNSNLVFNNTKTANIHRAAKGTNTTDRTSGVNLNNVRNAFMGNETVHITYNCKADYQSHSPVVAGGADEVALLTATQPTSDETEQSHTG